MKRFFCAAVTALLLLAVPVFFQPPTVRAAEPEVTPKIYAMALRPDCAGVYYKCRLEGDTSQVAAWGVALSTVQMPDGDNLETLCKYTRTEDTSAASFNGALLTGVLEQTASPEVNEENGKTVIYGRAYAQLQDGSYVFGEGVACSLSQLLAAVDGKFDTLTEDQQTAALSMYEDYIAVLHRQTLTNIHGACHDGTVFNAIDARTVDTSIQVLSDASYSGLDLADRIYTHAFSASAFISDNIPEDTLALLAEGTATAALNTMVVATTGTVTENELVPGDLLFADGKLYICSYRGLCALNGTGAPTVDTGAVLAGLADADSFALLRPALAMTGMTRSDVTAEQEELNEYQKAIKAVAEAYYLRGEKLQYADTRFTLAGVTLGTEFRWELRQNAPEDCTDTDWGYTNCAAFTYEVYYQALGYQLPNSMYTTSALANSSEANGTLAYLYERKAGSVQTEEEMQTVRAEFLECLQPGDILVLRREDGSGHALLYVGDGNIIHSSGAVYKYTGSYGVESYEASVRRVKVVDYFFNKDYAPRGYVFEQALKLLVVRPLQIFSGDIPESSLTRMENMEGIVAQKLCSHVKAQTVAPGETVTFTYKLHNTNDRAVTLKITENVPAELEYLSGCDGVSGSSLTWTVAVPAGEQVSIAYQAKVREDVVYGTWIQSTDSTVGGITVKCAPVQVRNKLAPDAQTALIDTVRQLRADGTELTGLALVNAIYDLALGRENIMGSEDFAVVTRGDEGCFSVYTTYSSKNIYRRNTQGAYADLLAPTLYGGYRLWSENFEGDRTRLPKQQDLQVGDVLLGKTSSTEVVYMYLGEELGFVNMNGLADDTVTVPARLERLLAYGYYFAIMRPAQALEP